ncbi:MAG: YdcF family protein [Mesorhizobium sp.]|nr:YdcF family protein [Mesorhizobium sp.]MCO5161761.1 YdcF family protein [Mesorhizobium sp.]
MTGYSDQEPPGAVTGFVERGPWQTARWLIAGAFGACLLFLAGFAVFASHIGGLSAPQQVRQADAIIVVTGGQSRIDVAVDLLRSGKGKRLLISGVNPMAKREDLRAATGGDRGLFACCVDIDHAALDTIGNAEESAKWVRGHAYDSVILVTNNYHMPRTMLEMRRLLDQEDLQPYPVVNSRLDRGSWLTKPEAIRVLFTEYTKFLAALARVPLSHPAAPGDVELVNARSLN